MPGCQWARLQNPRRKGSGPRAGKGAAAGGGGWARLPRAEARAPPPALLSLSVAGPQAHAQSPGSCVARGLSFPGWLAGLALSSAGLGGRRAEEEGGRERAGRRAGGRGRRGASGASSEGARSSDEKRDGAAAPGRASSATPPPPPPSESGPQPGSPRRRAQGWGGTRPGKVARTGGRADAARRTGPGGEGSGLRRAEGPGGTPSGGRARGAAAGSGPLPGALMAAGLGEGGPERLAGAAGPPAPPEGRLAGRLGAPPGARRSPPGQQVWNRRWGRGAASGRRSPFVGK